MQTKAYDISMDQNGITASILVDILTTFHVLFIYLYVDNYKLFHKWPTLLLDPSHIFSAIWYWVQIVSKILKDKL
jgi:hypothetical protein